MTSPRPRPTRSSVAGAAHLDLRASAQRAGRPTAEYLRLYALEGFLARLAASEHAQRFVLKGGVLLAAYELRRPTADIDFAARALSRDADHVRELVTEVLTTAADRVEDDGLQFDLTNMSTETTRDEDEYSGVRVTLRARLATAVETFHLDINVGDPVSPAPGLVRVPRLLGGEIELLGYPIVMVLAEKLVTALQRGTINTRWRDFGDIYLLTALHETTGAEARQALDVVATHRQVELQPLATQLVGYAELAQTRYRRWRDRQHLDDRLPDDFAELVAAASGYADPLVQGLVPLEGRWQPARRQWSEPT